MNLFRSMVSPQDFPTNCPGCHTTFVVPAGMGGKPVTCDTCHLDFILPCPPLPSGAASSSLLQTSSPATSASGTILKNILLLLSGAAAVWGVSTFYKKPEQVVAPFDRTSVTQLPPAGEPEVNASTSIAEPVITTTRSTRPRPKLPSSLPAEETTSLTPPPIPPPAEPVLPGSVAQVPAAPPPSPEPSPAGAGINPEPLATAPATSNTTPDSTPPEAMPAQAAPADGQDFANIRRNSRLTLERFLLAGSVSERLALSQKPDKIRPAMEKHYRIWPDSPMPLQEVAFLTAGVVPDTSRKFHLYNVILKGEETPIPLAVEETDDGYRVDWPTFAESYTHALRTFFAAPVGTPSRFRVMLRRAHYFGPPVPGQDSVRISYTVEPPMRDETFHVWVDKDSPVYQEKLATGERAGWEAESYVIVELLWKGDEKRGRWVGLHRIPADSWRVE